VYWESTRSTDTVLHVRGRQFSGTVLSLLILRNQEANKQSTTETSWRHRQGHPALRGSRKLLHHNGLTSNSPSSSEDTSRDIRQSTITRRKAVNTECNLRPVGLDNKLQLCTTGRSVAVQLMTSEDADTWKMATAER
jgi:hypothetical protein